MSVAPRVINSFIKYLKTWKILLLHPAQFLKITARNKREHYWAAIPFLAPTLLVTTFIEGGFSYFCFWIIDPSQPFDAKALFKPSDLGTIPILITLGIETFLLYAILHNWSGHRLSIRTTTPFRRIFNELVYINSPIILLGVISFILFFFPAAALLKGFLATFETGFEDLPDIIQLCLVILVVAACLIIMVGPWFVIQIYYYEALLTALFKISRRRAVLLSLLIIPIAALPVSIYQFSRNYILPAQLSGNEQEAALTLKAAGRVIESYSRVYKKELSVGEIRRYIDTRPETDIWRMVNVRDIALVMKIDSHDTVIGYKLFVQAGRFGGYIHAVPLKYGGETKYSFVGDLDATRLCAADRNGGLAFFTDKSLILLGDN